MTKNFPVLVCRKCGNPNFKKIDPDTDECTNCKAQLKSLDDFKRVVEVSTVGFNFCPMCGKEITSLYTKEYEEREKNND